MSLPGAASRELRAWHPYTQDEWRPVLTEIAECVKAVWPDGSEPSRLELATRLGEFRNLVKAAERGELVGDDWKAVVSRPELWWAWCRGSGTVDSMLWRGYFHEPDSRPGQTVLARVHRKKSSPETTRQPDRHRTMR